MKRKPKKRYLDAIGLHLMITGSVTREEVPSFFPWVEVWTKALLEYLPCEYRVRMECLQTTHKFSLPQQCEEAFEMLRDPGMHLVRIMNTETFSTALLHLKDPNPLFAACKSAKKNLNEATLDKQAIYDYFFGQNGRIEHGLMRLEESPFDPRTSFAAPPDFFLGLRPVNWTWNIADWDRYTFALEITWPRFLFPDGFPLALQELCLQTLDSLCSQIVDCNGYVTTDHLYSGFLDDTAQRYNMTYPCWGNCLKKDDVDAVGGIEAFRSRLDCETLKELPGGKALYTLSPDVNNFDRQRIRSAMALLLPYTLTQLKDCELLPAFASKSTEPDWYKSSLRHSFLPEELEFELWKEKSWRVNLLPFRM